MLRMLKIYSPEFQVYEIVNDSCHTLNYILRTHSSFKGMFVPFDQQVPIFRYTSEPGIVLVFHNFDFFLHFNHMYNSFSISTSALWFFFFFLRFYSFIFREGEREGEKRDQEKYQCIVASRMPPYPGPGPPPRHVPSLEIESATLWFSRGHSVH